MFPGPTARRLGAAAAGVLLSGAALTPGPATAKAVNPGRFSLQMLGSFHLTRVDTTTGTTSTGVLLCMSGSVGDAPVSIRGTGGLKDPTAACQELAAVGGDFTRLAVHSTWLPPNLFAPVDVKAHGTWNSVTVDYSREFTNSAWLVRQTGDVFVF
ncbi:MAG: SSI family serine proteinase inhibitor [Catenulispora sp.]